MKLTIRIHEAEEGGWVGQIEEIPAVIEQGETLDELKTNLADGVRFFLDTQRAHFERDNVLIPSRREELELA